MSVLSIRRFSKRFGEQEVLKDLSLDVAPGEVVSILGPSGSGKSTLLRCAALLEKVDSGDLFYGNLAVCVEGRYGSPEILRAARGKFGLVFQNFNLFPHWTVLKNIADAPAAVRKRPRAEVEEEARKLLADMGLAGRKNAYPCELSGGQQQRVSIARALAMKPEILFFDEPTSALDPELTQDILQVLRRLAEKKMTMVIVTHEIDFAKNVSDRIVFMEKGVIVESGPAKELVETPREERTRAFLAGFRA